MEPAPRPVPVARSPGGTATAVAPADPLPRAERYVLVPAYGEMRTGTSPSIDAATPVEGPAGRAGVIIAERAATRDPRTLVIADVGAGAAALERAVRVAGDTVSVAIAFDEDAFRRLGWELRAAAREPGAATPTFRSSATVGDVVAALDELPDDVTSVEWTVYPEWPASGVPQREVVVQVVAAHAYDPDDAARALRKVEVFVTYCFLKRLATNPLREGGVSAEIAIGSDGVVQRVRVRGFHPEVERCVEETIERRLSFRAPATGPASVSVWLELEGAP